MSLARLSLTDFRSYPDLLVEPGPGLVILTGENGAGKTNILEAVSLLAPGRGLRGAALADMARSDGPGGFAVAAQLQTPLPLAGGAGSAEQSRGGAAADTFPPRASGATHDRVDGPQDRSGHAGGMTDPVIASGGGDIALGTGTLAAAPDRRLVRINTTPAAANSLSEWLSILWLTPAMDRLFIEGAAGRRRFLDRLTLALHPGHATHAARYDAAMRARNKLLAEDRPDPAWLDALEARMAEHGGEIARARADTVTALSERLAAALESPFARAAIAVENGDPAPDLRDTRSRDAAAGRTLAGPHRADLLVTHAGKQQPAGRSSTGEQKALLLGLILAHAELVRARSGRPLILLLDEVAAHLDPSRRAALFARLADGGGQVWMTGTEPDLFVSAPADATRFEIVAGRAVRR